MTLQDEIYKQIIARKQIEDYQRQKEQLRRDRESNVLNKARAYYNVNQNGDKISNIGKILSKSQNENIANVGNKIQSFGDKLSAFGQPSVAPIAGQTGVGGSAIANGISSTVPTASATLPSAIGAGTAGAAGTGAATGSSALGSSALGSSLLGATGGGTAAGMGTAGATSALSGSTAAATGAGAGAAGLGAAGGAAAAVPVVGWALAAAAIGKMIKDKLESAQHKINAKAMQADAQEMQRSAQANQNVLAKARNNFVNDSEQAAQNMTLPDTTQTPQSLSQDIMSQINPNYTSSDIGSPVGYAAGINYPEIEQTLQNDQSIVSQNEKPDLLYNPIPSIQVAEGRDGGAVIPKEPELKESLVDRIRAGLTQFKDGYDDNSLHGFSEGDMAKQFASNNETVTPEDGVVTGGASKTDKTIMNRLGEAAGTGRRLMANPWVQAGIAGVISKADGGDIGDIAKAAYQYGTAKQKADQYYKLMNPDAKVMPVFNTLDANDYKAKAYNDFNKGRTMISRRDLIKLQNPDLSDEQIDAYISGLGIDGDEMISLKGYDSVNKVKKDNRDLDIKQYKANNQKDYWDNKINVDKQKVGVQQQNANTNAGKLKETKRSNQVKEKQNQQKIDNTANKQNVKNAEEELKARGYKKVNGQWVKQ